MDHNTEQEAADLDAKLKAEHPDRWLVIHGSDPEVLALKSEQATQVMQQQTPHGHTRWSD